MASTLVAEASVEQRAGELLARAEDLYGRGVSWDEFESELFGPDSIGDLFPTRDERRAYIQTPQHRRIRELSRKIRDDERDELPSGQFRLRLPRSLHAELTAEAEREGVTLNALCVAKLSTPLDRRASRV